MLKQVTQRVWCLPWEEERDRPSLYYIRGDRRSLAVDAGSSPAHVAQFYAALEKRGLPLPDFTAVTHWHWDHTFGLGAVQGVTLASALTNRKLRQVRAWEWTPEAMARRERRGEDIPFCNEHIRREYPDLGAVSVSLAEMEVEGELTLHLGGVDCRLFCRDTPIPGMGCWSMCPRRGFWRWGTPTVRTSTSRGPAMTLPASGPCWSCSPPWSFPWHCRATAAPRPAAKSWSTCGAVCRDVRDVKFLSGNGKWMTAAEIYAIIGVNSLHAAQAEFSEPSPPGKRAVTGKITGKDDTLC